MKSKTIIVVVCIAVVAFLLVKKWKNESSVEGYSITRGMLKPQTHFYDRCVNDCFRNKTGDSANEQFLWTCTDECQVMANNRIDNKIEDITNQQHQRHIETIFPFINYNNRQITDTNYCIKDISDFCNQRLCNDSFDKEGCIKNCIRVKTPDCTSGLFGGWRP